MGSYPWLRQLPDWKLDVLRDCLYQAASITSTLEVAVRDRRGPRTVRLPPPRWDVLRSGRPTYVDRDGRWYYVDIDGCRVFEWADR